VTIGPGSRVGPYEVTALIGEGGMGRVWRARHTGLNRDDALKVLPESFAADPERLARFQREAQLLASLNHPNIAHVFGLENVDDTKALVMELVEGPTLADRIARGPLGTRRSGLRNRLRTPLRLRMNRESFTEISSQPTSRCVRTAR
jgi:serine/threonine protein kinase